MLKFNNINEDGSKSLCKISMSSVQGGVLVEADVSYPEHEHDDMSGTILLTPMDAAYLSEAISEGVCLDVGHHIDMETLRIDGVRSLFVFPRFHPEGPGDLTFSHLTVGGVVIAVPYFVIAAMQKALDAMMPAMMYPSTGDREEEFA